MGLVNTPIRPWASFWICFRIVLVSFWISFGIVLGLCWGRFGIVLVSFWNRFGIVFGMVLGSGERGGVGVEKLLFLTRAPTRVTRNSGPY